MHKKCLNAFPGGGGKKTGGRRRRVHVSTGDHTGDRCSPNPRINGKTYTTRIYKFLASWEK
eukprot:scaffold14591_cov140-Isochrysis_galbana.AAC.6